MSLDSNFLKLCYSKFGIWIEQLIEITSSMGQMKFVQLHSN